MNIKELSAAELDRLESKRIKNIYIASELIIKELRGERDAALAELNETRITLLAAHTRACSAYAEELETTRNERDSAYLRGEERMRKVLEAERDRLITTIKFYASHVPWTKHALEGNGGDYGTKAREVLASLTPRDEKREGEG